MARIQKNDVIDAVTVYLQNENRPCPAYYLVDKFGDDVADVISSLKKDGVIVGRRGRNGGIVFPDTVFTKKDKSIPVQPIQVTPVNVEVSDNLDAETEMSDMDFGIDTEFAPF